MDKASHTTFDSLRSMLRPLAVFCLRRGLTANELIEALKAAFLDEAQAEIQRCADKVTTSRLALMSGLTRREVDRVRRRKQSERALPSIISRVMTQWAHNGRFCRVDGKPKLLLIKGAGCSFNKLVQSVSNDIHPSAVLLEMLRLGVARMRADEVELVEEVQYHTFDPLKGLHLFWRDVQTLAQTVQENLFNTKRVKNLHLRTSFDNICRKDLIVIRRWIFNQGKGLHRRARAFLAKYDKDLNPELEGEGGGTVVLGTFGFTDWQDT